MTPTLTLSDGRRKALAAFERIPFLSGEDAHITVRGITASDLDLLNAEQTAQFLGTQDLLALPIKCDGNRLTFRARWRVQQQIASAPETSWFLEVAAPTKEAQHG